MLSLDECKKHAANGEPCQMMTPDGKWVPFNEHDVITKFRVAPRLFQNSGPRILMYALLRLEEMVERHFRNKGMWIDLPAVGFKKDWTITGGSKGLLGARDIRVAPTIEDQIREAMGQPHKELIDSKDVRLRDIFRTYFRIVKEKSTLYRVQRRRLSIAPGGDNGWENVFSVGQDYFKENDNFNTTSEKAGKSPSWCIMVNFDSIYLPKAWKPKLEKYQYSCCERYPIRQQRIQSVSRITPCGNEVLNNIALYICNYLTFISRIDMNLKDFSDFIDNNMEKTDDPTHYLTKPDWVPGNRSLVVYKQYDEFDKYRAAALGKNKYDESGYLDHHQTQAILLRYFNAKYHGTIYEVRH